LLDFYGFAVLGLALNLDLLLVSEPVMLLTDLSNLPTCMVAFFWSGTAGSIC
jgi:hypothetical protein